MAFWTNPNIQIKQKNKFVISIGEFMVPTVVSCDKPKLTIEKKEYTMINQVYRYPGVAKWQPITIKFIDGSSEGTEPEQITNLQQRSTVLTGRQGRPIPGVDDLDAAQMLWKILLNASYADPESGNFSKGGSPSKASMMDKSFLGSVRIEQLESDGETVSEGWRLYNPIITELSWGSLDYGSTDAVEYSMTIEYDYAKFYVNYNDDSKGRARPSLGAWGESSYGKSAMRKGNPSREDAVNQAEDIFDIVEDPRGPDAA